MVSLGSSPCDDKSQANVNDRQVQIEKKGKKIKVVRRYFIK